MSTDNSSILKTYLVVIGVCLVASLLVSAAVVKLAPRQKENQRQEEIKNILIVAGLYVENADIDGIYKESIEKRWLDLQTGTLLKMDTAKLDTIDIAAMARSPEYGKRIPAALDIANIKRSPKFMPVYFVKQGNKLLKIILPVYGKGLWSTLYGFLALDGNAKSIAGISFYQQGETPGLGGEISNPRWQKQWQGKQAFDAKENVVIRVVKGEVRANSLEARYQVEGLSGATLTSRGVNNLVRYWLGDYGYGPFLKKIWSAELD